MKGTTKLQRNRFDFYNDNYSNKIHNLSCFQQDETCKWEFHEASKKLVNLGEVEDFLLILKLYKNKNLSYTQILNHLDGLSCRGSARRLLSLDPTKDLEPTKDLDYLGNVDVKDLTQTFIAERQKLVDEVQEEMGLSIEVLDLIIIATKDYA